VLGNPDGLTPLLCKIRQAIREGRNAMGTLKATYRNLSLAVKYSSVLFPFDVTQFLQALSRQNFVLPEELMQPVPHGGRLKVSGRIARKGEVAIQVDTDRQVVAVNAADVKTVVTEMNAVDSLLSDELNFDSSDLVQYYEFLAGLTTKAKRNPLDSWHTHFSQVPIINEFSKILKTEVSPLGLRLSASGQVPNQPNWFDIRIVPLVQSAKNYHLIEVVFRNSHRDPVFDFARGFEDTLIALLSQVEQG
jgi:hypothetical protein